MNENNKNFNLIPTDNFRQFLLLIIFGIIMLFIRIVPYYHLIFTNWPGDFGNFVHFSEDDAVYQMRLVHNTIHHFPLRIFFDPFTHFPFGNMVHIGPLFTLIIAASALIIGLGHPSPELINIVGAYIPPIMGALCLIPIYFMARKLFGSIAAIFTTFIFTFLPGTFLQRSSLGFTDHHVAETLFSSLTCVFLIHALTTAQNIKFSFKTFFSADHKNILIHGILSGIAFGLFLLIWPAALMFGVIFLIFFMTQLLIDHLKNRDTSYLLFLVITIYSLSTLMVLPYALMNPHLVLTSYSLNQPLMLITMTITFVVSYIVHRMCQYNQLTKDLYLVILAAVFAVIFFFLYISTPQLVDHIQNGYKMLFDPSPGMRTVLEVRPSIIDQSGNRFTFHIFWFHYFWTIPFSIIGLGYLLFRAYKNSLATEIFLLIWSIAIILAAIVQIRFNYYLAVNVAILAGCYCIYPFFNILTSINLKPKLLSSAQRIAIYLSFCGFAFLIIDPILKMLIENRMPTGSLIPLERYNSFIWLKNHTPNPQGKTINKNFDYVAGYYPIPKDLSVPYKYPQSAYGVMSWWDLGHQITYIAERIPNTNPFQNGIIEKNNTGACLFFTSNNEAEAVANLDEVGTRYVLIDLRNSGNMDIIGVWCNAKDWTTPLKTNVTLSNHTNLQVPIDSPKYLQSMLYRLFYQNALDLQHFRLIYESGGDYWVFLRRVIFTNEPNFRKHTMVVPFKKYEDALKFMNSSNHIFWANKDKKVLIYQARPPVKATKIFEKVKGAVITGRVPKDIADNFEIGLSLKLITKSNRILTYKQTTKVSDGKYQFIVPYPTMPMRGIDYNYDIEPIENYQLQIGPKKYEVFVSENDVISGNEVGVITDPLNTLSD